MNIDQTITLISAIAALLLSIGGWLNGRKSKGSLISEYQKIAHTESAARQEMEQRLLARIAEQDAKIQVLRSENEALRKERNQLEMKVERLQARIRDLEEK